MSIQNQMAEMLQLLLLLTINIESISRKHVSTGFSSTLPLTIVLK